MEKLIVMMVQMKSAQVMLLLLFCFHFIHGPMIYLPVHMFWADYCRMSGIEGFNCMSEKLCVPQAHVCDGYPDCVIGTAVFDEMNCIPESGIRLQKYESTQCNIKGFLPGFWEAPSCIQVLLPLYDIVVGCTHGLQQHASNQCNIKGLVADLEAPSCMHTSVVTNC